MSQPELQAFYKALGGRLPLEPTNPYYVPIFEHDPKKDPIERLRLRITLAESQSVNLLTGFRGNGKSTQLRRLKKLLENDGCYVVLVDMTQYVLMTKPPEISDFILSLMAALAVESEKTGYGSISESYWARLVSFLKNTKADMASLELAGKVAEVGAKLGLQLKTEPTFKQQLQLALRGHVTGLVRDARAFVIDLVEAIRKKAGEPNKKVVLLVDSVEQIRGVGTEAQQVHKSVVNLFSGHAGNLQFDLLHLVYTVPPFLIPLAPKAGQNFDENSIVSWPNIHVRDKNGTIDENGLSVMREIIARRHENWECVFSKDQLNRLAVSSGGDVRDFFRLIRECLISVMLGTERDMKVDDVTLDAVEAQLRSELLPIAADDGRWLARIEQRKDTALETTEDLPRLARFLDSNLIMNYLNGEPWYDIHPLLVAEISKYAVLDANTSA